MRFDAAASRAVRFADTLGEIGILIRQRPS
jgi:hypothetical protein